MKKNVKPENTRKTVYLRTIISEKIEALAKKDNRTFSSFVAMMLERLTCDKH